MLFPGIGDRVVPPERFDFRSCCYLVFPIGLCFYLLLIVKGCRDLLLMRSSLMVCFRFRRWARVKYALWLCCCCLFVGCGIGAAVRACRCGGFVGCLLIFVHGIQHRSWTLVAPLVIIYFFVVVVVVELSVLFFVCRLVICFALRSFIRIDDWYWGCIVGFILRSAFAW